MTKQDFKTPDLIKALIFVSAISDTIYLWNGSQVICIKESSNSINSKNRKVGQLMKGFSKDKVDFENIYNLNLAHFQIEDATYKILNKI